MASHLKVSRAEILSNWVMESLPHFEYVIIAIAPPGQPYPLSNSPVIIVTPTSPPIRRAMIEKNPLWIAGVFKSPITAIEVQEAIQARYDEITEQRKNEH